MSDLPQRIIITEEGPREGFQIEPGPIRTEDKIRFIDLLSNTGLSRIQVCSFVSPRLVPGWADADAVVAGFTPNDSVDYTALWFNQRGIDRALTFQNKLTLEGSVHLSASEPFSISNLNRDRATNLEKMREQTKAHVSADIPTHHITLMAAFGCNFAGDISPEQVVATVRDGVDAGLAAGTSITSVSLCDTMGWANPSLIQRVIGAVRDAFPTLQVELHLHDTRGLGIANAHAGLQLGVTHFDTAAGGLGGCPFAKHKGAPGNIATEELVLLAEELGIHTGVDLDALIDAGQFAESIVGHTLPSATLKGGSLNSLRQNVS